MMEDRSRTFTLEDIFGELPGHPPFLEGVRRAPKRDAELSDSDVSLALKNALRYVPEAWQETLIDDFLEELDEHGRIYGYRFRPHGDIVPEAIEAYRGRTMEGKAFQVMIANNLSFDIALYPYELVTYGESGQVFQNWMQYRLTIKYLQEMNDDETLVLFSGHPLGLFASSEEAPRVMLTNGLMVGMYDNPDAFARAAALGVTNYGQMTAGGWMYIGPQGIVHGTYSTLLNAGRLKLGIAGEEDLAGVLFVSSGLGGMSGAQGKAAKIAGGVGLVAEVDVSRIKTRYEQGWVDSWHQTPEAAFEAALAAKAEKRAASIAYDGNIVDLLEHAVVSGITIDLLSDQTSCHNVYEGGYTPKGMTFEERTRMLKEDKPGFKHCVDEGLKAHYKAIETLTKRGTYFFDYGNSFMKAVYDAGVVDICKNKRNDLDGFIWPSYVEDIMGPILFDFGYGPFRWVCLSGKKRDLQETDRAAMDEIDVTKRFQDKDNHHWIARAADNELVVGTQARILYQDAKGRLKIALRFNEMVRRGIVGPIMLGRDHHDTGGTDSPFRETANIKDGSNVTADMATHVFAGNAARGMSLVALHNGGGVGTSKSINGGYGMLLDGSERVDRILKRAMTWDVMAGVARRAWAQNDHALQTAHAFNTEGGGVVTMPHKTDETMLGEKIRAYKSDKEAKT